MRRPHVLRGNQGTETPHEFVFFDTETDQIPVNPTTVEHRLRFGWALHVRLMGKNRNPVRVWFRFETPAEFVAWLVTRARPQTRLRVMAHRLQFDARVCEILPRLTADGWKLKRFIIEDPPTIFSLRKNDVTLEFLDTRNWFAHALVKLGERVGLPKLEMPSLSASSEIWDRYCKRDVEVIEKTVLRWISFVKDNDLGSFAKTLAGQSFNAYRHRFMKDEIFVHANEDSLALARASYTAGRVECMKIGRFNERVSCYDVNSMYPFVMATNVYPSRHVSFRRNVSLDEMEEWRADFGMVARVVIETNEAVYPYRTKDKLLFPVGCFETFLAGPELFHAAGHGRVRLLKAVALYETAPIFRSFVREIFALREKSRLRDDEVERYLLKILLNSLYGKFGQQGKLWETVGGADENRAQTWIEADYETGSVVQMREYCGNVQELTGSSECYHSLPSISSYVTSYARLVLWDLMQRAGPGNVFYVDTDSLVVNEAGTERLSSLIDTERLGGLKLEWSSDWVEVRGPKDYETEHFNKVKGVRWGARWIDRSTVEQEKWSSIKADIQAGEIRLPRTETITKRLSRLYTKGIVLSSGDVLPPSLYDGS